jgi:guanylate kinase
VRNGDFLEHATVHGNSYGTLRETVLENLERGVDVLLDIDIQGAEMIRRTTHEKIRAAIADVFLMPPTMEVLRQRLLKRGTEGTGDPAQLAVRLKNAEMGMQARDKYHYNIVSGTPEDDFQNFRAIMLAERQLSRRLKAD